MTPLRATYRLQLHRGFRFADVRRLVPYLDALGVSHVYLSPILRARTGSTHGYDVTDPAVVNPELGSEGEFRSLVAALRRRRMGVLLDVVPNHMAASDENPYWDDVLARGITSPYASWFDVDWGRGPRPARLLLPVLGEPLPRAIATGALRVVAERGRLRVRYHERSFPVAPDAEREARRGRSLRAAAASFAGPVGRGPLRALLDAQPYQLEFWRRGVRRINYRRFFTISDLVGVRVEDPAVFAARHALLGRWLRGGLLDGLRIDHIDGLRDPRRYLRELRALTGAPPRPLLVEKILARDERLRREWPVAGTTGYDFLNEVEDVQLEPGGVAVVADAYRRLGGRRGPFAAVAIEGKRKLLRLHFVAEVARLAERLADLLAAGRRPAPSRARLAVGIREFIAHLPVYRTYVDGRPSSPVAEDVALLRGALAAARRAGRTAPGVVDALRGTLLGRGPSGAQLDFVQQLQQLCAAAAAKGVEDTALYLHVPLVSRNEVGGDPATPVDGAVASLHAANRDRSRHWPAAMLAVSTHDTKRGADARARLDVLSECPVEWAGAVARWRRWNRGHRGRASGRIAPDFNTEYLFYQSAVAVWPLEAARRARAGLTDRLDAYMLKAAREAKQRTSWIAPDPAFERALSAFVRAALSPAASPEFLGDLEAFVAGIAPAGLWNALARTTVQLTAPGVPDVYQGDDLWSFTLVDPDNRHPVDYAMRRRMLAEIAAAFAAGGARRARLLAALVERPQDGRIKLHVVRTVLAVRRRYPALFVGGEYLALAARGPAARHVFAFARRSGRRWAVTVIPRCTRILGGPADRPPVGDVWGDTRLLLPAGFEAGRLRSVFTGERYGIARSRAGRSLAVAAVLARFPVAVLVGVAS